MSRSWSRLVAAALASSPGSAGAVVVVNTHAIEGYANKLGAAPGEIVSFSVHAPSAAYTVTILRYGRDAGPEVVAGPFSCSNGARQDYTDTSYQDGLAWPVSFRLTLPAAAGTVRLPPCTGSSPADGAWRSGLYVARLAQGSATFDVTFVVKDAPGAQQRIALLASTNTWQAYNFWGGGAYYAYGTCSPAVYDVSFLRPNPYATPEVHDEPSTCARPFYRTEHLAAGEARLARWFERRGHAYSMLTDYDLDGGWNEPTRATALDPFDVVVVSTHNEYWSTRMYKSVTAYLERGGNLIVISGNTAYRWVTIDRTAKVMHKQHTSAVPPADRLWDDLSESAPPFAGFVDKRRLLGTRFAGSPVDARCSPFVPTAEARASAATGKLAHWAFTGIADGQLLGPTGELASPSSRCAIGSGASGEEVDRETPVFARAVSVLGRDAHPVIGNAGDFGSIVHLVRASAGQVFTIGSITAGASLAQDDPALSTLLENVLARIDGPSFSDFSSAGAAPGPDGHPDLVVLSGDTLVRHSWTSATSLSAGVAFGSGFSDFDALASPGDFDGDGRADLLARTTTGELWLFPGTGSGGVAAGRRLRASGWSAFDIITPGDFDHDGRNDIFVRRPNGTLWLGRGDGQGGFTQVQIGSGWDMYLEVISPGDFGSPGASGPDGNPDLIGRTPSGALHLYYGRSDGTLVGSSVQFENAGWETFDKLLAAGDFDGDGDADLLARTTVGALLLYEGTGDGTLVQSTPLLLSGSYGPSVVSVW